MRKHDQDTAGVQGDAAGLQSGNADPVPYSPTETTANNSPTETADRYRNLFQRSADPAFFFQVERDSQQQIADWTFLDANDTLAQIFGRQANELPGAIASQTLMANEQECFLEAAREAERIRKAVSLELTVPSLQRVFRFSVTPLGDGVFTASGSDVTSLQQAQKTMLESQERFDFLQKAAEFGVWDWDAATNVLHWDNQCRKLFGLSQDAEVNYDVLYSLLHPDDLERTSKAIQRAINDQQEYNVFYRIRRPDQKESWIHAIGRSFQEDGKPVRFAGVAFDITARRQAEVQREQLAAENNRQTELFQRLMQEAPFGVAITQGPEHRYALSNNTYNRITAVKAAVEGQAAAAVWPEAAGQLVPLFNQVYQQGITLHFRNYPLNVTRERGLENAYFTFTLAPLKGYEGPEGVIFLINDTTEQVLTTQNLFAEQVRLQAIFTNAPVAILFADRHGRIQRANRQAEQILSRPIPYDQDYASHAVFDIRRPDGSPVEPRQQPLIQSALDGATLTNVDLVIRRADGRDVPIQVSSSPLRDAAGATTGAIAVFQDISERRDAEAERLRSAATIEMHHYLMQSREMERLQIAHQLHEGLLQELISLQFGIDQVILERSAPERQKQMNQVRQNLATQIRELRDYCYELRPPALAPFGLEKAIRSHAEGLRSKYPQLDIQLDLRADFQHLPESIRLVLFRVYQELITNVIRHAGASKASVRFQFDAEQAELEVSDEGLGFSVPPNWVEAARRGRLGLVAAQERVEAVGGQMHVHSDQGRGTRVVVQVPIQARASGDD